MKAKPTAPNDKSNPPSNGEGFSRWPFFADVEADQSVTVEVALPEPGVILAGEKEQFNPLGIPAHERVMGLLNDPD